MYHIIFWQKNLNRSYTKLEKKIFLYNSLKIPIESEENSVFDRYTVQLQYLSINLYIHSFKE